MEQFIFTNASGDSLTISYTHNYNILKAYDGLSTSEILPDVVQGYSQNGYSLKRTRLGSRFITLEWYVYADDMEAIYTARKQLGSIFNPTQGKGVLAYTNDAGTYYINALCTGLPTPTEKYGNLQLFSVELTAHNPFFYGTVQTIEAEDDVVSITNDGDMPAPFTVTFAPDTSPQIYLDDGTKIEVASGVAEEVTVKTAYGEKLVLDSEGNIDFNLITADSTFFSLPVGTFNLNCGGVCTIQWKPLYVGV